MEQLYLIKTGAEEYFRFKLISETHLAVSRSGFILIIGSLGKFLTAYRMQTRQLGRSFAPSGCLVNTGSSICYNYDGFREAVMTFFPQGDSNLSIRLVKRLQ